MYCIYPRLNHHRHTKNQQNLQNQSYLPVTFHFTRINISMTTCYECNTICRRHIRRATKGNNTPIIRYQQASITSSAQKKHYNRDDETESWGLRVVVVECTPTERYHQLTDCWIASWMSFYFQICTYIFIYIHVNQENKSKRTGSVSKCDLSGAGQSFQESRLSCRGRYSFFIDQTRQS